VEVLDSESGEPVRGLVRIVARDGSMAYEFDSQDVSLPPTADPGTVVFGPFYLAHERPGTYKALSRLRATACGSARVCARAMANVTLRRQSWRRGFSRPKGSARRKPDCRFSSARALPRL
jgi:hypothetical protein